MMRESGAHQLDGSKEGPRGRILPWLVLLVVVISGVYGQVVTFDFLTWDDPHHITENPRLNPVSWESVAQFWTEPYWGLYIPLSYTFFAAEATIAQAPESSQAGNGGEEGGARVTALNPAVFHFGSLLLHLVCVVLVFLVLHKLTDHAGAACMAALLFGLHPVQVESIAWVSETRGLLCAAFSLLAIRLFMLFSEKHDVENVSLRDRSKTEQRQKMGDHATRAIVWYFAATLCFLLALLAKPAAVAVPLLVGVLAIGWLRMPVVRVFSMLGPWLLLAAAWALLTRHVQPATELPFIAPWWSRPLLAGDALAFYLLKVVAPWPCGPDYGYNPQWMMGQWWFYYGWILPVVVAVLLFRAKHRRVWLTAAGLSVFWLLPVLGFIPFIYQRISMVADRYLYLAMLGPALMAAWVLSWTWNRRGIGVGCLVLGLWGAMAFVQTANWRDSETLIAHGLCVNPQSVVARQNASHLLIQEDRYDEAVTLCRETLKDHPQFEELYLNLAVALASLDRKEEAVVELEKGIAAVPSRPLLHLHLGNLLMELERVPQAEQQYRRTLELDPLVGPAHMELAKILTDRGSPEQAAEHYLRAIEIPDTRVAAHVNLGALLQAAGYSEEAEANYREALRLRPNWSSAHYNLANLLASRGNFQDATKHYETTLRYSPNHARAHVNLAVVLTRQNRASEAAEHCREAIRLEPDLMEARLNLGQALLVMGRDQAAAATFRAALKLVSSDSPVAEQIRQFLRQCEEP